MANNFVAKNDFNRGGYHKDHKNDYDRTSAKIEIEDSLYEISEENLDYTEIAREISLIEYARSK